MGDNEDVSDTVSGSADKHKTHEMKTFTTIACHVKMPHKVFSYSGFLGKYLFFRFRNTNQYQDAFLFAQQMVLVMHTRQD